MSGSGSRSCQQGGSASWRWPLLLLQIQMLFFLVAGQDVLPSIKGAEFESAVTDIQWLGPERRIVLLSTMIGRLHQSNNGGRDWADVTNTVAKPLMVARIMLSPANSSTVVIISMRLEIFASTDAASSWHRIDHAQGIRLTFMFHPTKPSSALISVWTADCRLHNPGSPCTHKLMVTHDLGKTPLRSVSKHVVQFSWGKGKQGDRIYFTHFRDKNSAQKLLTRWMQGVDFVSTDNEGQSLTEHVKGGNRFVLSDRYILVAAPSDATGTFVHLMVSSDGAKKFSQAQLPNKLDEHSYSILDASEGLVVLHVNHGNGLGNIYVSDASGIHYTLSLEHNVGVHGSSAFEKVSNLNGIYFANIWESADPAAKEEPTTNLEEWLGKADYQLGDDSTETQAARSIRYLKAEDDLQDASTQAQAEKSLWYLKARSDDHVTVELNAHPKERAQRHRGASAAHRRLDDLKGFVRSVISFDVGGAWTHLKPPSVDSLGNKISCPPTSCWLHIHDTTFLEKFVPFYSYDKAVGIIMGAGNIGPQLSYDQAVTNTYLSRDGGLTWSEVHKGVYIYEFGNHGAVLAMADLNRATQHVIFSLDEGNSWKQVTLDERPMNVTNILIEPTAVSTEFVAYGTRAGRGVLYHMDFDALGWRPCKSPDSPDSAFSDYEIWSPSDGVPAHAKRGCLMGQQVAYVRRKQASKCFNRLKVRLPTAAKACPCTKEDFECELGFERAIGAMSCEKMPSFDPSAPELFKVIQELECTQSDYYQVDQYRRVANNHCSGGFQPPTLPVPCPSAERAVLRTGVPPLLKITLVVLPLAGIFALWKFQDAIRYEVSDWCDRLRGHSGYREAGKPPGTQIGGIGSPSEMREISRYQAPSIASF